MKIFNVYLKDKKSDDYFLRRVKSVKANTLKEAREKAKKMKIRKNEVICGIHESNGCDCGQMSCGTCN